MSTDDMNYDNALPLQPLIGTVDYNGNVPDGPADLTSLYDPTVTYTNDKIFCMKGMFVAHMVLNYVVFISGIICFSTRVLPVRFRWIHAWSGRVYILAMLWTTAVSTAMTNTGLPLPTLISFAAVLGGMSLGWIAIVLHHQQMDAAVQSVVNEQLQHQWNEAAAAASNDKPQTPRSLDDMMTQARRHVVQSKTFRQRFVSWKAVHGILLFVSWMQIAGRMFASNQSIEEFTCHTYPAYKPIATREGDYSTSTMDNNNLVANLTLVPPQDKDYQRLPWANNEVGWSLMVMGAAAAGGIVVGLLWSLVAAWHAQTQREAKEALLETKEAAAADSDSATPEPDE